MRGIVIRQPQGTILHRGTWGWDLPRAIQPGHLTWVLSPGHRNITVLLPGLSCAFTELWGGPALHARGDGDFGVVLSLTR